MNRTALSGLSGLVLFVGFAAFAAPAFAQCTTAPLVEAIGEGSPGLDGVPRIESSLPLLGAPFEVRLVNGRRNSIAGVLFGFTGSTPVPLPMFGATLYPTPPLFAESALIDGDGNATLFRLSSAFATLCGVNSWMQAVAFDDAAIGGVAFTGAIRVRFGAFLTPVLDPIPSPTQAASATVSGTGQVAGDRIVIDGGSAQVLTTVDGAGRFSASVPLTTNAINMLYVLEEFTGGTRSPAARADVIQDIEAPELFVDVPSDNAQVPTASINVSGRVGDRLSGFMGLTVTVNGRSAVVNIGVGTNGTFDASGIPLNAANVATPITVVATDRLGNQVQRSITVTYTPPTGARLQLVSGANQTATVQTDLPNPVVVQVFRQDGTTPYAGKVVTFDVTRSNGLLRANQLDAGTMRLSVLTDAGGFARALWRVGSDAGCGNNRVAISSTDIAGGLTVCASATPAAPDRILVGSGSDQLAAVGGPAPEPLKVWVNDACNGVAGVPVVFTITQGLGGLSDGTRHNQQTLTVPTGATGHAQVAFTVGPAPDVYVIEADFAGNPGQPAVFQIRGLATSGATTTFEGLVLDNSQLPIQNATCSLSIGAGAPVVVMSDAMGVFRFNALAGAGLGSLYVDGATATHVGGQPINPAQLRFPSLHYTPFVAAGAANSLSMPVLLPRLNPANDRPFDGSADVVLTVAGIEGLRIYVPRTTTVRHADGRVVDAQNPITLALNQVNADNVPMPINDGAAPDFAWTLQPGGTTFSPPLRIEYPNTDGAPPGSIVYFLSFDHATSQFAIVASGRISDDGSSSVSDPGTGIATAGWGCRCPPYPPRGDCERCTNTAFRVADARVRPGATPSMPLSGMSRCTSGFTYPERIEWVIRPCREGNTWRAVLVGLTGHYSLQSRLTQGVMEVTGPTGNTTQANFCDQATDLSSDDPPCRTPAGGWHMLASTTAHEQVHASRFSPGLRDVARNIETLIEATTVPYTGQSVAAARSELKAALDTAGAEAAARTLWLNRILVLVQNDHDPGGACDIAERAIKRPMIDRICAHARTNSWGPCAACN